MTLLFHINNQTLSINPAQKNITVVADSRNYLKVAFAFNTKEWQESTIVYALFSHCGKTYKKILGIEEGCAPNECYVAPEVIKEGGFVVSVYADNLITTNSVSIPVLKSGYTENIENQRTTPSVMEQMNEKMYQYAKLCNDIYEAIKKEGGDE